MASKTVYLNGGYLPLEDAKVSVLDRGFLFGDGVYEVIPAYHGKLFRSDDHWQRLENSLGIVRIANPHSRSEWQAICEPLLDKAKNQYIYLQVTRGVAEKRDHAFPEGVVPTVFVMCSDIAPFAGTETGIKAVTMDDSRWKLCHAKTIALLGNILHRQSALDQGSAEAILLKDGHVTEGAASNVFAVVDGVLVTPPKSHEILPGITRDVILELAGHNGISCREDAISQAQLQGASEIWVTSSTREIIAVVELDGVAVGNGVPGPAWHSMDTLLQAYKQSLS
jgi:D-alanine transaminase